jgi:hypothetical protein
VTVTASPLRPKRIERESHVRAQSFVNRGSMTDLTETPPWFSFVDWGQRPGDYTPGRWDQLGSQLVAQTPVFGVEYLLEPGVYIVYLKVGYGLEQPVLPVGRLTIA